MEDIFLQKRLLELAERSYKCSQYFFTGFLSSADISVLHDALGKSKHTYTLWGGSDACERKMARFGTVEAIGYEVPFPIEILHIENAKGARRS